MQDFQGFPSLQEVECSGRTLHKDVDYLSLNLFKLSDKSQIATVRTSKNTCNTFTEYASCHIDTGDNRNSVARTLVSDLRIGQSTVIGCTATVVYFVGHPQVYNWSIRVFAKRKISRILLTVCLFVFIIKDRSNCSS